MTIKTASIREINKLSKSAYKVLVTRGYPFWIKGIKGDITEWCKDLAPSEQLLGNYRSELKKMKNPELAWNLSKYDIRFRRQILRDSGSMATLRRLIAKSKELKGKRVVILICYESTDEFCHRRILKELMEKYNL